MVSLPLQALRVREQMRAFLGNLPKGVPKTARRFCLEALYGVVTRRSLRLSEIARALCEEIAMIKTENRLSRQAARENLHERLTRFVIAQSAHRIKRDTLLIIDPSDIAKPHAKKMEHLTTVRDGSDGGFVNGYWLCQVIACECGGNEITPLVNHLWSHDDPQHLSENDEVLRCIDLVADHAGDENGIWVIDRGGDRMSIFEVLLEKKRRFLVRLIGNRHLVYNGKNILAEELARQTPLKYIEHVIREKDGKEQLFQLSFGMRRVALPDYPEMNLCLVVLEGFGEKPLMILTTEPLADSRRSLWWAVEAYLTRWRIEETLRFAKQTYDIEDVRVLGYQSLRNMMALALLAMSFTMLWLGQKEKLAVLVHHALRAAKRFFGVPDFRYYAIADGLAEILSARQIRPFAGANLTREDEAGILDLFTG